MRPQCEPKSLRSGIAVERAHFNRPGLILSTMSFGSDCQRHERWTRENRTAGLQFVEPGGCARRFASERQLGTNHWANVLDPGLEVLKSPLE